MERSAKDASLAKESRVAKGKSTQVKLNQKQRVDEFPEEMLVVSAGKLYCEACHTVIALKSIVKDHIMSSRHIVGKEDANTKKVRQQRVVASWEKYEKDHAGELSGTDLSSAVPPVQRLRRIEVVTSLLQAGISLAKADQLRPLLEEGSVRLTHCTHLASYIPFIAENEKALIKEELNDFPYISVIFDGSTYLGEALVVLVRFVNDKFEICQRLVRVHVLAKSLKGQDLAREVISVLSKELQYPSDKVIDVTRNGEALNGAACNILKDVMYPKLVDLICISHCLDNVGKRFETPLLDAFLHSLFTHSPAAKMSWRDQAGEAIKSYSCTRWWSWWEMLAQIQKIFHHVLPFLQALQSSPTACEKLLRMLQDDNELKELQLQLCIVIDVGKLFVTKTYRLEGNGELIVEAYAQVQEIAAATAMDNYPLTLTAATEISGGNQTEVNRLMCRAKACVAPAICYFRLRFSHCDGDLFRVVSVCKAVRILCTQQARQMQLVLQHVDGLRVLPSLDNDITINRLKDELPAYIAAAEDVVINDGHSRLQWWKEQGMLLAWQSAAKLVFAMLPSSAPAERVFSLMQASITRLQRHMLNNQLEVSLMLQYNRR